MSPLRLRFIPIAVALLLSIATLAHADTTVHFDLPTAPLGLFGIEYTADFLSPVADIDDGVITSTRIHLEFNTAVPPNPFQNAEHLAILIQPPVAGLPLFTATGAEFGWSGTGLFTVDFETDELNLPILDFPPDADFALWFVKIFSINPNSPQLGGQLTNSYIEFDISPIPGPGAAIVVLAPLLIACRRRASCTKSARVSSGKCSDRKPG